MNNCCSRTTDCKDKNLHRKNRWVFKKGIILQMYIKFNIRLHGRRGKGTATTTITRLLCYIKAVVNTVGGSLALRRVFCWLPFVVLFLSDKLRRKHLLTRE